MKSFFKERGFTLVELLVVMAVIGLVMGMAVPVMNAMNKGSKLTASADSLKFNLSEYRALAIAENIPVEVRFFKSSDAGTAGERRVIGYQAGRYEIITGSSGSNSVFEFKPAGDAIRLSEGVVISENPALSTIIGDSRITQGTHEYRFADETSPEFFSFTFRPDGSTNLSKRLGDIWFLTLLEEIEEDTGTSTPNNFHTLTIDAYNGNIKSFQR
jgi:uncharacterized protein (TIGR02596 family)